VEEKVCDSAENVKYPGDYRKATGHVYSSKNKKIRFTQFSYFPGMRDHVEKCEIIAKR
jgi:hypothetical protein